MADVSDPGTLVVQIDGLAEPRLRCEIEAGDLPTRARNSGQIQTRRSLNTLAARWLFGSQTVGGRSGWADG